MDLTNLEEHGKAGLYRVAGDNLWSHSIGEFIENHSEFFCRYSEITRREFLNDLNLCGPQQSPDTTDSADLQAGDGPSNIKWAPFSMLLSLVSRQQLGLVGLGG